MHRVGEGSGGAGCGKPERVLGHVRGETPGPTLIAVGGLHGNEPSGILSLERVLGALTSRRAQLRGDFVAFSGNRGALASDRRFLSRDLNRLWTPERIEEVRREGPDPKGTDGLSSPEDAEQRELLASLDAALGATHGKVYFLDLHTTSGPGRPFTTIAAPAVSRAFALSIPVPLILGLGEMLKGTLTGHMTGLGIAATVFEGGQHADPRSVVASEAGVWLSLAGAGMILESSFPEVAWGREHLGNAAGGLPPILEMIYRHAIAPDDGFRMLPGFESFREVEAGEVLAHDGRGEVRSPMAGRLLMPLYQAQGEDGFFLVREVEG